MVMQLLNTSDTRTSFVLCFILELQHILLNPLNDIRDFLWFSDMSLRHAIHYSRPQLSVRPNTINDIGGMPVKGLTMAQLLPTDNKLAHTLWNVIRMRLPVTGSGKTPCPKPPIWPGKQVTLSHPEMERVREETRRTFTYRWLYVGSWSCQEHIRKTCNFYDFWRVMLDQIEVTKTFWCLNMVDWLKRSFLTLQFLKCN